MAASTKHKCDKGGSLGKLSEITGQDESSDSDTEPEQARVFHRRISTNKDIKTSVRYWLSL